MGAYKFLNEIWRNKQSDALRFLNRLRVWEYRQLPAVIRVSKPTRTEKAHQLGYKARQGVSIYRVRIRRGGRKRNVKHGINYGKPRNIGINEQKHFRNLRSVSEERVGRRCGNLRVLSSYYVAQDGSYKWFEVICVDPQHKAVRQDPELNWIVNAVHKHRELRGMTSAGREGRGLHSRRHGTSKLRPSRRATWKHNNTQSLRRYR
ncbi:ribosomal protein L15e [Kipferlia bialata]|uniref:Ribosomal protein L15 n=1 Tax=Kipferlia bialata TaxID=797122 RepID=A0A391NMN5_9EUKA|nr:ribosomal protein L15e [Kipferlia bialata]|eukprot:g7752.t1